MRMWPRSLEAWLSASYHILPPKVATCTSTGSDWRLPRKGNEDYYASRQASSTTTRSFHYMRKTQPGGCILSFVLQIRNWGPGALHSLSSLLSLENSKEHILLMDLDYQSCRLEGLQKKKKKSEVEVGREWPLMKRKGLCGKDPQLAARRNWRREWLPGGICTNSFISQTRSSEAWSGCDILI